ncbi:MAG: ATP-binding protein [Bacteroidota bacterium]
MLGIVFLLLLVTSALAYCLYQQQQKVQTLTETIADLQEVQTVKEIKANLEGRDQERIRMAQDWHDGIGNSLSTLRLIVDTIQPKNQAAHTEALALLEHTQREFRQIIRNELIHRFTNEAAIRQCLAHWQYQLQLGNIRLDYKVYNLKLYNDCGDAIKINLYRIVQELLTNVIKHAKAKVVNVILREVPFKLALIVSDDGVGWGSKAENVQKLVSVKKRLKILKGTIEIKTKENSGTSITIFIPIQ